MLRPSSRIIKLAAFAAFVLVTLIVLNSMNMLRDRRKMWLQSQLKIVELETEVLELKQRIRDQQQIPDENSQTRTKEEPMPAAIPIEHKIVEPRAFEPQTLNLALVMCGAHPKIDLAKTLLYSILMFSPESRIHYHLVVDAAAYNALNNSHTLDYMEQYTVYNVSDYNWIFDGASKVLDKFANSTMWSLCKGVKIHLPTVIPPSVDKLVLMDVDTMVFSPLEQLFSYAYDPDTSPSTLLHMVVDQSGHHYRHRYMSVYPRFVGFNSGVVLLHLDRMRNLREHPLLGSLMEKILLTQPGPAATGEDGLQQRRTLSDWSRFVMHEIEHMDHVSFKLGDQDLYNAVIARHSTIVSPLPCGWNYQLVSGGSKWMRYACTTSLPHTDGKRSATTQLDIKLVHGNNNRFIRPIRHIKGFSAIHAALHALAEANEPPVIDPGK